MQADSVQSGHEAGECTPFKGTGSGKELLPGSILLTAGHFRKSLHRKHARSKPGSSGHWVLFEVMVIFFPNRKYCVVMKLPLVMPIRLRSPSGVVKLVGTGPPTHTRIGIADANASLAIVSNSQAGYVKGTTYPDTRRETPIVRFRRRTAEMLPALCSGAGIHVALAEVCVMLVACTGHNGVLWRVLACITVVHARGSAMQDSNRFIGNFLMFGNLK